MNYTTDQAIAKTFRLDKLDRLDQIHVAEQTKPRRGRVPRPRINPDGGIDYAPEVDPYEDMDVEGLLNLEDYVPSQAEKQIAKKTPKPPQYEMDPGFWKAPADPPPEYSEIFDDDEQPALEAPPEEEDEEEEDETNEILDQLELPNYNDVEKRLAEPEMNATKQRRYLSKVVNDAEKKRKQLVVMKTHATNAFRTGEITEEQKKSIYEKSDRLQKEVRQYKIKYELKMKSIKGSGLQGAQRGRRVVFYNNAKELLEKLMVIIGEMEAGNTSIKMRNMGQTILETLLKNKSINKSQYQKIVKKYFPL